MGYMSHHHCKQRRFLEIHLPRIKVFGIVQSLWNEADSPAENQPRDFPYLLEAAAVMEDTGTFSNLHSEVTTSCKAASRASGQNTGEYLITIPEIGVTDV